MESCSISGERLRMLCTELLGRLIFRSLLVDQTVQGENECVVHDLGCRLRFGRREGDGGPSAVANAETQPPLLHNNTFLCVLELTLRLSSARDHTTGSIDSSRCSRYELPLAIIVPHTLSRF